MWTNRELRNVIPVTIVVSVMVFLFVTLFVSVNASAIRALLWPLPKHPNPGAFRIGLEEDLAPLYTLHTKERLIPLRTGGAFRTDEHGERHQIFVGDVVVHIPRLSDGRCPNLVQVSTHFSVGMYGDTSKVGVGFDKKRCAMVVDYIVSNLPQGREPEATSAIDAARPSRMYRPPDGWKWEALSTREWQGAPPGNEE